MKFERDTNRLIFLGVVGGDGGPGDFEIERSKDIIINF